MCILCFMYMHMAVFLYLNVSFLPHTSSLDLFWFCISLSSPIPHPAEPTLRLLFLHLHPWTVNTQACLARLERKKKKPHKKTFKTYHLNLTQRLIVYKNVFHTLVVHLCIFLTYNCINVTLQFVSVQTPQIKEDIFIMCHLKLIQNKMLFCWPPIFISNTLCRKYCVVKLQSTTKCCTGKMNIM